MYLFIDQSGVQILVLASCHLVYWSIVDFPAATHIQLVCPKQMACNTDIYVILCLDIISNVFRHCSQADKLFLAIGLYAVSLQTVSELLAMFALLQEPDSPLSTLAYRFFDSTWGLLLGLDAASKSANLSQFAYGDTQMSNLIYNEVKDIKFFGASVCICLYIVFVM
jgi:hypothetical protein